MNTISQFATDDPKQLGTQLSKLEQNVVKETASIRQRFELASVPADDDSTSPIKTYTVGDCARLDSRTALVKLNLAAPADGRPGHMTIVMAHGANGFAMFALGNSHINGGASAFGTAAILTTVYCDGVDFWF